MNIMDKNTDTNIINIINKIIIEEAKIKEILSRYSYQESNKKYVDEYNKLTNLQDNPNNS
jgi:hypothetical protein